MDKVGSDKSSLKVGGNPVARRLQLANMIASDVTFFKFDGVQSQTSLGGC